MSPALSPWIAARTVLGRTFDFSGRSRRSEFWWWQATLLFVGALEQILMISPEATTLVAALLFIPTIAVTARRLHDTGRSGWWQLIIFIPILGFVALVFWTVEGSQPGSNQYGPNPTD